MWSKADTQSHEGFQPAKDGLWHPQHLRTIRIAAPPQERSGTSAAAACWYVEASVRIVIRSPECEGSNQALRSHRPRMESQQANAAEQARTAGRTIFHLDAIAAHKVATRYDKPVVNHLASVQPGSIGPWRCVNESTSYFTRASSEARSSACSSSFARMSSIRRRVVTSLSASQRTISW